MFERSKYSKKIIIYKIIFEVELLAVLFSINIDCVASLIFFLIGFITKGSKNEPVGLVTFSSRTPRRK